MPIQDKLMTADNLLSTPCHWVLCVPTRLLSEPELMAQKREEWLSAEEIQRMDRFRKEEDRHRYGLAHIVKRFCLSNLLSLKSQDLCFGEGPKGKPFCENSGAPFFNISHSGDWVLFGVSSFGELGVDVESFQREIGDGIAAYVLNRPQIDKVNTSPEPKKTFMCYWTQKEAMTKTLGFGLSIDFKTVNCSGELGLSAQKHNGSSLLVDSYLMADDYIVSTATLAKEPLVLYCVEQWNELGFAVVKYTGFGERVHFAGDNIVCSDCP